MKLNLVVGGIFPIRYDGESNLLPKSSESTGFECAATFQGEGKLIGTPCLFIRTSSCNLSCAWVGLDGKGSPCDTPYSSHYAEKNLMEIDDIIKIVVNNTLHQNIKYIVVSGGEPTIQTKSLGELLEKLKGIGYHVTLETNATIYDDKIATNTDLISMSPKLSTSTPHKANLIDTGIEYNEKIASKHERLRINVGVIQSYIDKVLSVMDSKKDFQLKFVVSTQQDIEEIEQILEQLHGYNPSDICLMPEGVDVDTLNSRTGWIAEQALMRGWRFSPRLHVMMFGKNRYT